MLPPQDLWNDPSGLVTYYNTHHIPLHPIPGVLVTSIIVSILGSYATLLVLGRRTSSRGWRNHALLAVAATCFASVAVWGMHFVSMISVRLKASPNVTWYLQFSRGFTTLSLFVPLIATVFAFWFIGSEADFTAWRVVVSGVFVGLTIGLMHYSASFKLPFLMVSYSAVTVVFALILACVAATAALFAFFKFRSQWQDSFWKRSLCSLFLAAAVCGMHYLGLAGTSYSTRYDAAHEDLAGGSRQSTRLIITISIMCGIIILLSIGIAVWDLWTRAEVKKKARHITVALATFSDDGRILVKTDGTIPVQAIETKADLSRVLYELDPRRPIFQWLYQISFNWPVVRPFVPRVIHAINQRNRGSPAEQKTSASTFESTEFRSRFIEASILLAQQVGLSIEAVGTLFDRVLTTGTRVPTPEEEDEQEKSVIRADDESSIHGIPLRLQTSEGVLLFLVREISQAQSIVHDYPKTTMSDTTPSNFDTEDYWLDKGWRLTETRFYSKVLADQMGVNRAEMEIFLSACKTYAKRGAKPVVQAAGTYLAMFGVRPAAPQSLSGIDVLVYNFARHQIPAYRLPDVSYPLTPSMRAWIRECSTTSMGETLQQAQLALQRAECSDNGSFTSSDDEALYEFQAALSVAIESMSHALKPWPLILQQAHLSPEILELPSSNHDDEPPAQVIVFELILPPPIITLTPIASRASGVQAPHLNNHRHDSDKPPAPFVYTPWTLFAKSQNMLIRAKTWDTVVKHFHAELHKAYPLVPTDLADEVAVRERKQTGPYESAVPFTDSMPQIGGKWSSRAGERLNRITNGDVDHKTEPQMLASPKTISTTEELMDEGEFNPSIETITKLNSSLQPPNEMTPTAAEEVVVGGVKGRKSRPGTATTESGVKKGFAALVGMGGKAEAGEERKSHGPAIFGGIRQKADGWYLRSMATLARGENGDQIASYDWQNTAKGV